MKVVIRSHTHFLSGFKKIILASGGTKKNFSGGTLSNTNIFKALCTMFFFFFIQLGPVPLVVL